MIKLEIDYNMEPVFKIIEILVLLPLIILLIPFLLLIGLIGGNLQKKL